MNIDPYAISHLDHLNARPSNGTFLRDPAGYTIWEVAGGAPLVVSSCANLGGCPGAVNIDPYAISHLDHLNARPSSGTLIRDPASGMIWKVVGGAPLGVSSCANVGGCSGVVNIDPYAVAHLDHLNAVPADGTFIETSAGRVYRIAGGAPFAVSSWSVFGGVQPYVTVDQWDLDNITSAAAHLNAKPADGTVVEGLPSRQYWSFAGGLRSPASPSSAAIAVDDVGLTAFPQRAPAGGGSGGSSPSRTIAACIVPQLRHMKLAAARRALTRAHCEVGKVSRPRHPQRHQILRVVGQSARRGSHHQPDYRVNITLR